MEEKKKDKWYYGRGSVIMALLCFGPCALPLLLLSPKFTTAWKIIIAILVIVLTIWLAMATKDICVLIMKRAQEVKQAYGF